MKDEHIVVFAKLLLYVCQPCLTVYSFMKLIKTIKSGAVSAAEMGKNIVVFLVIATIIQLVFILTGYFIFRKKYENVAYRIFTVATIFGNFGFFGIPLIEAVLPDHPEAVIYSTLSFVAMNILSWTVSSAIITGDKKYISLKKAFLNPGSIAFLVSIPLLIFQIQMPAKIDSMFTLLGKFSTPLCMIIMGMRLATVNFRQLICVPMQYVIIFIKNIAAPVIVFALVYFLPLDVTLKKTLVVLCSCPVANVVQSFAELLGKGQKSAANLVLISTITAIATIPVVLLLLSFL